MTVLGLNAYTHDAGVALVEAGRPRFVVEEERFDRQRKTTAFPAGGVRYLRTHFGLSLDDVDLVAFPWRGYKLAWTVVNLALREFPAGLNLLRRAASRHTSFGTVLRFYRVGAELATHFERRERPRVRFVGHHRAHAASAFYLSPFDRAAVLVMDGYGDDCSTSVSHGIGTTLRPVRTNRFFDSVGILYSMITKYLGYGIIHDEGKVMALAAYGSDELCADFTRLVRLHPEGHYAINREFFDYHRYGEVRPVSSAFLRRYGPARQPNEPITQRHMDVARALQHTLEETVLHVARHLRTALGERALCFVGGTALNCLTNRRLATETGFDAVFVPPNPNDAGVALGAALALTYDPDAGAGVPPERRALESPYLGPCYDDREIAAALDGKAVYYETTDDAAAIAARALAAGQLVAWFQGAVEMGPRALGNRSILGDPRDPFLPDLLNRKIKQREYFRPYAPVVLAERAAELFEDVIPSPYMSFAARVRPTRQRDIPAVIARDGTARLQTVTREQNPELYRLISEFDRLTGIPVLLNTSFNCREPMVCTPRDAIRTFLATDIPLLVLGRHVVTRRAAQTDRAASLGSLAGHERRIPGTGEA